MRGFGDLTGFAIEELQDKCSVNREEIGMLDHAVIDFAEESLEITFCFVDDDALYVFWHSYREQAGTLTKVVPEKEEEDIVMRWGDWSVFGWSGG